MGKLSIMGKIYQLLAQPLSLLKKRTVALVLNFSSSDTLSFFQPID